MFQKYLSYYRIFHFNKLGGRKFATWQNSPIQFGTKFSHIQQNGNAHCNILFKPQQLRRSQFCSGNLDILDYQFLPLDPHNKRNLKLKISKGKSGNKYFQIDIFKYGKFYNVPKIPVPEDAYAFVRALDELIGELAAENFEEKLQIQDPKSTIEIANDDRHEETTQVLNMKTVELTGLFHKFQLELSLYINTGKEKIQKEINLGIIALNEKTMKKRITILPLHALPWIRSKMAEMLKKYDGTEKIEKEAPAEIPQKFFNADEEHSQNGKILQSNLAINSPKFSRKRNGHYNIFIKSQKLCQHNQFCSGNDGIHPVPVENSNSSLAISSPEMPTNNIIEQEEQQRQKFKETEKSVGNHLILETQFLVLDIPNRKKLKLELEKGKSGQKFFQINLKNPMRVDSHSHFSHILVPQDAYAFVRELDELIGELATENFEQKLKFQAHRITVKSGNDDNGDPTKVMKLKTVEMIGMRHKFQLELMLFVNTDKGMEKIICLRLYAVNIAHSNARTMILPLQALPWLRTKMAEMLEKYDGTEKIEKETTAEIPQQFLTKDIFRATSAQNAISSGQKNKGMQQQFVNKKPTSFQQYPKMPTKMQNLNHFAQQKSNFMKKPNNDEQFHPQMTDLENGIRALFDFNDEEMENYRRIAAAKTKYPSKK